MIGGYLQEMLPNIRSVVYGIRREPSEDWRSSLPKKPSNAPGCLGLEVHESGKMYFLEVCQNHLDHQCFETDDIL